MKFSVVTITLLAGLAVAAPQRASKNQDGNTAATKANANGSNSANGNANNAGNNANGNANSNANSNANKGGNANQQGNSNSNSTSNVQDGSNDTNAKPQVSQEQAGLMSTAVDAWMRDTGVVSNFLNIGGQINDDATFKNQALIAHSAEVDELTHKNVLDQFMPNNKNVKAANATLSNGAFQLVVDQLRDMSLQGTQAAGEIDSINKDRCVNVLPNIDAYMREAALTIGNGQATQQSVRPAACANIQPGQDGALKVNEVPQGYVNGKLQDAPAGAKSNSNSNTLPNNNNN